MGLGVTVPAFAQDPAAAPAAAPPAAPAAEAPPPPAEAPAANAAPERTANNAIYFELLGAALFYSINYDRRISDFALRGGFMYFSVSSASWLAVPLSVSYLGIGSQKHCFEIGGGITIHHFGNSVDTLGVSSSGSATLLLGHAILGYRYQPLDGGFFLRAGVSPIVGSGVGFLPWPHVGLGGTF
jgi:hypothetical protein